MVVSGVVLFGFVVPGFVVPGVVLFGVVVPGFVVPGAVPFGVVVPGVVPGLDGEPGVVWGFVLPAGGVAVLPGGVAVPAGGVAAPGVDVCPLVPDPPAGADPPEGELWASTQLPQHKTTNNSEIFVIDILIPLLCPVSGPRILVNRHGSLSDNAAGKSILSIRPRLYPADAVIELSPMS